MAELAGFHSPRLAGGRADTLRVAEPTDRPRLGEMTTHGQKTAPMTQCQRHEDAILRCA